MDLFYSKGKNFGDDLNEWLWSALFERPLEDISDSETMLIGVGTILNERIPSLPKKKIVFGSGYGYGNLPQINKNWNFICVRGPLTAKAIGLDNNVAICDSAILVKEVLDLNLSGKSKGTIFIPHHSTVDVENWQPICNEVGIEYVNPKEDSKKVISKIASSELVITEAMHGAIIADTYRVPWIPVRTRKLINKFKWDDWTASLDISYEFNWLPPIWNKNCQQHFRFKNLKREAGKITSKIAVSRLRNILKNSRCYMSKPSKYNTVYESMLEKFNELKIFASM